MHVLAVVSEMAEDNVMCLRVDGSVVEFCVDFWWIKYLKFPGGK